MQSGLSTLCRIRQALQAAGDALALARLEALEASEAVLVAAVSHLAHLRQAMPSAHELPAYRDELRRTRRALDRCLRLGAALNDVARATLVAQGRAGAYGREGQEGLASKAGGLHVRG